MGVTQDCWGQGVGAALMNAVIEWLEARGVQRIELVVATDNRRALRLYRRYGFEIEGCQRGAVRLAEGDWRDDYQMARLSSQLQRELAEAEAK
jgi:RimJ/RimL family protein N-acetyltransferase